MHALSKAVLAAGVLLLVSSSRLLAQLSGAISVPSLSYPTLASVVSALNVQGVGPGGVVVNILPANPQLAPAGGYLLGSAALNTTTSTTKTITINGNGNTVVANTGTNTATDGIFIIQGVDYLTINALNLSESVTNLTATTQMEWGYALVKRSAAAPYDGCQNDTIRNCVITLNKANVASAGVYAGNHLAASTTQLPISLSSDANSQITMYADTIQNCYTGIFLNSSATALVADQFNAIGGSAAGRGNVIRNFGGGTALQTGINALYQSTLYVGQNTISNMAGGGSAGGNAPLYGILYNSASNSSIINNTITLQQGTTGNAGAVSAITDATTGPATGSCLINKNTISGSGGGTGTWYGIDLAGYELNAIIDSNIFNDINLSTTAAAHLIHVTQPLANGFGNCMITRNMTTGTVAPYIQKAAGNNFAFYYNTAASTGTITASILDNTVTQVALTGATTFYGIYAFDANVAAGKKVIYNNTISNITGGTSAMYGIAAGSSDTSIVYRNTLSNMNGGGIIYCLNLMSNTTANVYRNKVTGINGVSTNATVYGAYCNTSTGTVNLYNNFFTDLTAPATSSNTGVNGIYGAAGTVNVYENTIVLGKAATITGGANFSCAGVYSSSPLKLHDNIIYVNATATGTGIAACVKRNTVANGIGMPPTLVAFNSDNNIYYINPAAQNYIYEEGITVATVKNGYGISALTASTTANIVNDPQFNKPCSIYKNFMAGNGESASFFENNITSLGAGTYAPSGSSYAESGGVALATDDYAGATRATPPDIGALQFSGTVVSPVLPVISYTPLSNLSVCAAPVLTATITAAGSNTINTATALPRLYYKKSSETNAFGTYPADNTATFNGWKYVSATGTAPNFSFTIDYTKLHSAFAVADTIQYFVIAEDNAATPNVGIATAGFAATYCLTGVNIPPAAGTVAAVPAVNSFRLLPAPAFTISRPDTVCRNATSTLRVTIALPDYSTHSWSPVTNLYTNAAATIAYTGGNEDTVYVKKPTTGVTVYTATATNGTAQCLSTATDTITVLAIDTTVTGNLVFCAGDSTTLTAASGNASYTYSWLLNGVPVPGATASRYTVHSAGSYAVAIADAKGCPDTPSARIVMVNPLPVPVITAAGMMLSTGTFISYEWRLNDTVISGATANTYTAVQGGSYTVAVTDSNGCKGISAAVTVTDNTGVFGGAGNSGLIIYPNPACSELRVTAAVPINVRISSMDGKLLMHADTAGRMNISSLADGIYVIMVTDKTGHLIRAEKLVKAN